MHICSSWMGLVWQLRCHSCVLEMALLHLPRLHSIHSTAGEQRHFPKHRVCTETSCSLWVEQLYPLLEVAEEKENDTQFRFANQPPHLHPHTHSCFSSPFLFPLGNIPLTTISVLGTRKGVALKKWSFLLPLLFHSSPVCSSSGSLSLLYVCDLSLQPSALWRP